MVATTFGVARPVLPFLHYPELQRYNAAFWLGCGGTGRLQVAVACQPNSISDARSHEPLVRLMIRRWRRGAAAIGRHYANHKNKETADKLLLERQNVEVVLIRKFNAKNAEVAALIENANSDRWYSANVAVTGADYNALPRRENAGGITGQYDAHLSAND